MMLKFVMGEFVLDLFIKKDFLDFRKTYFPAI